MRQVRRRRATRREVLPGGEQLVIDAQVVGIILVVTSGAAAQRDGARVVDRSAGEPAPTRTDTP
ncbi:hypothetical protein [Microbacterium sp. SA075R]|uniref:hypothetical protein n=1 Tax=Microbacterium sp. SA075R TaxID=3121522 RepID=UPI003B9EC935